MTTRKDENKAAASPVAGAGEGATFEAEQRLREMQERFALLEAQFDKLQAQQAKAAAAEPPPREPDPVTHGLVLACGHIAEAPNPNASHHWCEEHTITVPVRSVFELAAA